MTTIGTHRHTLIITLLASTLVFGCTLEEPVGDVTEGQIIALFPDEGAAAVPRDVVMMIEVANDLDDSVEIEATLEAEGADPVALNCSPSNHDHLYNCLTTFELEAETWYTFTAEIAGAPNSRTVSNFATSHPEGLGYEIAREFNVERVGGLSFATTFFNALLSGESALLLVSQDLHTSADLPSVGTNWVWGPGAYVNAESAYAVDRSVGYPLSSLTMVDEQGTIFGSSSHSYLPLLVNGQWLPIRVDDLVLRGSLDPNDPELPVSELNVEANIPKSSIDRIASLLGATDASLLESLVELDVDTDLDGVPDAARLVASTQAVPAPIFKP